MTDQPTRQAIAAKGRSGKLTVSGKLKTAVDLMLYDGSCRADAAKAAGMTDHGLREAFKKPHVKAYYNAGLEVLRTSERAKNIRRLAEIRDAGNGTPAVNAVRALEQLADQDERPQGAAAQRMAGLVVQINVPLAAAQPARIVDHTVPPPSGPHAFGLRASQPLPRTVELVPAAKAEQSQDIENTDPKFRWPKE